MPRPRFLRLPEHERNALLQLAAEEFAREGFFGASYNRIIERSPLGKSSVYLAFDDKEDLFFTVLQQRLPVPNAPLPEALSTQSEFWSAVATWIDRFGQHALEDPMILPLAQSFYALLPNSERARALEGKVLTVVARFVARGQALGAVRRDLSCEQASALALGSLVALDQLALVDAISASEVPPSQKIRKWEALAVDLLRRILSPASPPFEAP